jgi:DNA-binding NarL/FixJ family response regulator
MISTTMTPMIVLTTEELKIIKLVADGHCYKDIAARLNIAESTVKVPAHNIFLRVGAIKMAHAMWRSFSATTLSVDKPLRHGVLSKVIEYSIGSEW